MVGSALDLGGGRGRVGGEWEEGGKKVGAVGRCALELEKGMMWECRHVEP
jgi:hypothetical protein